jgi:hypothetical protein
MLQREAQTEISGEQFLSHEGNSVSDNDNAPSALSVILIAPLWKQGENWIQNPRKYTVNTQCIGSMDRNGHQSVCLELFMALSRTVEYVYSVVSKTI